MDEINKNHSATGLEIAVIGMAGRFPGAENIEKFWQNLLGGVESISFFLDLELENPGGSPDLSEGTDYIKARGILENIDNFDASFFGYIPEEAEVMDPQVRLFHEVCWETLEDAGYDTLTYNGFIGLYAGAADNVYWRAKAILWANEKGDYFNGSLLSGKDFLCTRVSYMLNLKGPAVSIQTACSTSLVALHLACRSLLSGECHMALAGGVSIVDPQKTGYTYQEGMLFSRDGHVRAFDEKSSGMVFGSGIAVVLLKVLQEAEADRDNIYAVIKGTAINNDGSRKVGYTAPSVEGQAEAIKAALLMAEIDPVTIGYVETHGTGTALGDNIEIKGLVRAFNVNRKGYCRLGAVKTNVGHLDAAAGITGFIKAVLVLKHKQIPPTLHFEKANAALNLEDTPFYVNKSLQDWTNDGCPRIAAVSSFGIGGTNAHVVLEEWTGEQETEGRAYQLILLSARTETALEKTAQNLAKYLKTHPHINLADAAYTLQVGRRAFPYRQMAVCSGIGEAVDILSDPGSGKVRRFFSNVEDRPVIFMFPGLGGRYENLGFDLYREEIIFRQEMNRCFDIVKSITGCDLKGILYPDLHPAVSSSGPSHFSQQGMTVFIFEYALAKLLIKWGIKPQAMIGYSFGEYTAACLAGVFSLEDALKIIAIRGELVEKTLPGGMLSVPLEADRLRPLLSSGLSLAVDNGSSSIVSGAVEAVDTFEKQMKQEKYLCIRLPAAKALHSKMMEPILQEFKDKIRKIKLHAPRLPYISNVTGKWIKETEAASHTYWVDHLRQTVRFSDGIKELVKKENAIFIEMGPGRELCTMMRRFIPEDSGQQLINPVNPLAGNLSTYIYLLHNIGKLWLYGIDTNPEEFYGGEKRFRISLPTYPFERKRHWFEKSYADISAAVSSSRSHPGVKPYIADWFYTPSWIRSELPLLKDSEKSSPMRWIVFLDEYGLGELLAGKLAARGDEVTRVKPGTAYTRVTGSGYESEYTLRPGKILDYEALFRDLRSRNKIPDKILHFWSLTSGDSKELGIEFIRKAQDLGFYSLVYLARAIKGKVPGKGVGIFCITNGIQEVSGVEALHPEKATIQGPLKVIPQEYPGITCKNIDIEGPGNGERERESLAAKLLEEIGSLDVDTVVAYRGNYRWVETFTPVKLEQTGEEKNLFKQKGVYLLIGGLGRIGLLLSLHLARSVGARLVLTGRSPFPHRDEWDKWLAAHDQGNKISGKIKKLREIEAAGGEVIVFGADAADLEKMETVISLVEERWGCIQGIVYAAGIVGGPTFRAINQITQEDCQQQFRPKIEGLLVLEKILRDRKPDFCLLMSSISSVLGGLGFAAYSAANLFMDSFARKHKREKFSPWICVNWSDWKFGEEKRADAVGTLIREWAMTPEEAVQTFNRVLSWGKTTPLIQSPVNLQTRLAQWIKPRSSGSGETIPGKEKHYVKSRPSVLAPYAAPRNKLEKMLVDIWQNFFGIEKVGIHDDFLELGGDSLKGMRLVNKYSQALEEIVHVNIVFDAPTIAELSAYITEHYSLAAARILGTESIRAAVHSGDKVNETLIKRVYRVIPSLPPYPVVKARRNRPAIFILSPPRSGSTLLRVILAGHPGLFAPPELNLLSFNTLQEMGDSNQGCLRAIMQIKGCGVEEARDIFQRLGVQQMTTLQFYQVLQEWLGDQVLVDKTPQYAINHTVLERIGAYFESPFYLHLLRHPYGMIWSFEEAKMDLIGGGSLLKELSLSRRQYAELIWTISHRNILECLKKVPGNRRCCVKYEDLVSRPRVVVEGICRFLGLDLHPGMLEPYQDNKQRMTDGIYSEGLMMGDIKFHRHTRIDTYVAHRWKEHYRVDFLGDVTWKLAESFGYQRKHINEITGPPSSIKPAERREYYPVSPAQRRLYILQQMNAESTAYNVPILISLSEEPAGEKLEGILRQLTGRHESLRTSFEMINGEPMQRIHDYVIPVVEYYPAGHLDDREDLLKDFVRPFDPAQPPLLRVGLVRTGDRHILLFDLHHMIMDAVSKQLLAKEFILLYVGQELPSFKLQYKDYSVWQQGGRQRQLMDRQAIYWIKLFSNEPPLLDLPVDYPRPVIKDFAGAALEFVMASDETQFLKDLAKEEEATLYMLILAIFNVLLSKLSGQEDIVVGTPIDARRHADLEHIIGMFVNTLPMRNSSLGIRTFREFLKEVKIQTLRAYENQEYPFEELVERVVLKRDTGRNPLFDVILALHKNERKREEKVPAEPGGVSLIPYKPVKRTSKFDILLNCVEIDQQLNFTVEYCTALFKEETIRDFTRYFKRIVSCLQVDSDQEIFRIDILSTRERKLLLEVFNNTRIAFPGAVTLHDMFEDRVEKEPDIIVTVFEEMQLSGRGLNQSANPLAAALRERGIKQGNAVGLMMERSLEMMTALWGILKSGGVYLPIDPGYPQERIDYILKDSNAKVVLSHSKGEGIGVGAGVISQLPLQLITLGKILSISISTLILPSTSTCQVDSDNLAYIIYTSGSTGQPKGVMVEHNSVINRLNWMQRFYSLETRDVILQKTPFTFDVSVWELFWACIHGGKTCLLKPGGEKRPDEIIETIAQKQVTTIHFVPSMLEVFLEYLEGNCGLPTKLESIKRVFCSGETLNVAQVRRFNRIVNEKGEKKLVNLYGPTEATVDVSYFDCSSLKNPIKIPIGKPIDNIKLYILDKYLQLRPVGVVGELCISGIGLARGYLGNSELTGQKFIANPFSKGERIYRTGDTARWLPDGNIEFIGRMDHQVKIRGFRIEPAEIEAKLLMHPRIKEVVVAVKKRETGEPYLCAYWTADNPPDTEAVTIPRLREYLMQRLPDYMVPAHFLQLETIPLKPNGKIERKALPDVGSASMDTRYAAPAGNMEKVIADIWEKVLNLEKIGIHDVIFELGGTSLDIIRLNSKLKEVIQRDIPIMDMFKYTTIRSLAQYLNPQEQEGEGAGKETQDKLERGKRDRQQRYRLRKEPEKWTK